MKQQLADEIIACLPKERTLFYYQPDAYALQLLRYQVGNGVAVRELKKSPFAHLLQKPLIKKRLAVSGNGQLTRDNLWLDFQQALLPFVLTLTTWGEAKDNYWQQTSRPGSNLVLQMNFPNQHEQAYRRLIKPDRDNLFNCTIHPITQMENDGFFRHTLAWSRIDLSLDTGEALIEEIQSDWCSEIAELKKDLTEKSDWFEYYWGIKASKENVKKYIDEVVNPYMKLWDEAMLSAVVAFIYEEIGIETIYYHSFDTGQKIKKIGYSKPPRSLYTRLPRKFGFSETTVSPQFIMNDKASRRKLKKIRNSKWFVMQLNSGEHYAHLQTA